MALSAEERRALPESDFAVPGKRALPINDRRHVKMAWSQVSHTKGLSEEERAQARRRIKAKAEELGIDTSGWEMAAAANSGLYVRRNLTAESAAAFREWALGQGFINPLPDAELHVTIVHSRVAVPSLQPVDSELIITGGDRDVLPIGDGGTVALMFESPELEARWGQAIAAGATWDHEGYLPHVTIAWNGEPSVLGDVAPFTGDLVFGPEIHEPLNEHYVEENGLRMEAVASIRLDGEGLEAMSLQMPDVAGHPNRMPFSGVLTFLDTPSDKPPRGSKGRRVILTTKAAERALPSLLGMAVDFTPSFDGHDATNKVGVITAANIGPDPKSGRPAVLIDGFVYARDFPAEASRIQTDKQRLGFSWELADIYVERLNADPLVITDAYFTGAAILLKDKAAYTETSLAASAQEITMTKEEMTAAMADALAPALTPLNEAMAALAAATTKQTEALASMQASAAEAATQAAEVARNAELEALKKQVAELTAAAEPARKTLSPAITALLAKADLTVPGGDDKLALATVDAALSKVSLDPQKRMEVKAALSRAGKL